ncbi:tetratricopeptide repeat protein [Antarctobacter heliothermus]|uniref:Tetratricopeptide repeat-containing protein n=1 Tax=Antarctobacter heliothermus TaxID=74033 RepID=A0A239BJS6_9RHOB|nr:tetratricopeptide repeat protein [Antarctobacter heliothermus]SNS08106.1 Tetratricopeptide repeat-containing protein [Antarctobacter heliothermus]
MTAWTQTVRAGLLAAALTLPTLVSANGFAGDYLAARQASFLGDYKSAALFYGKALARDPGRPELLERAVLSNISLGEVDRASTYADRLAQEGFASQIAQMAIVARDAHGEAYAPILKAIDEKRGLGPLADGLIKAWAQLGQGDMTDALATFDDVAGIQGLGPFAAYHKAFALASVGDYQTADDLLSSKLGAGMGATRRGIMARAEILSQLDRNGDAIDLLTTAFGSDLDPGLEDLRTRLQGNETVPFTHVTSPRDGIAEVFYTLAGALAAEDNQDLTLLYARLAEYLRADHIDAILLSAEVLTQVGQYDLAVETYARVPVDHPAFHAAELGRAEALRSDDRVDEAIAVLEGLTETHGNMSVVYTTLGDFLRQQERFSDAIEAYTTGLSKVEEITERQWFVFYARAISNEREGLWEAAEADFRKALDLNPDQPQVLNYLGYSLVEKQVKLDEALAMIERAVKARPNAGYIVDSLGWVLYRLGRYEEAVPHMEHAAELMPIDPIVNDHLGDVYWAVGREREAEFMWKRALSFVDWEDAAEEADPERIKRKLEVGLDVVLAEEGSPPLQVADDLGGE